MSYDLMVFEKTAAPRARSDFMKWYASQTEWSEDHSYDDPTISSLALRNWYFEIIKAFPPMNGPHAVDDIDDPKLTDYSVGREVIYAAFSWDCAEEARATMRHLAIEYKVGFFDVSADSGEILFDDEQQDSGKSAKPWRKFW